MGDIYVESLQEKENNKKMVKTAAGACGTKWQILRELRSGEGMCERDDGALQEENKINMKGRDSSFGGLPTASGLWSE